MLLVLYLLFNTKLEHNYSNNVFSLKILRNFHLWAKLSSETFHNLYFSSLYFDIGSALEHAAVNRYFAWSLYGKGGSVLDVDVLFSIFSCFDGW